jgi:hypothetical protein
MFRFNVQVQYFVIRTENGKLKTEICAKRIKNAKFQIPNPKFQIPNSKFQIPTSSIQPQITSGFFSEKVFSAENGSFSLFFCPVLNCSFIRSLIDFGSLPKLKSLSI